MESFQKRLISSLKIDKDMVQLLSNTRIEINEIRSNRNKLRTR